jgi:hypothetical protein
MCLIWIVRAERELRHHLAPLHPHLGPADRRLLVGVRRHVLGRLALALVAVGREQHVDRRRRRVQHLARARQEHRLGVARRAADDLAVDLRVAVEQRLGQLVAELLLELRVQARLRGRQVAA